MKKEELKNLKDWCIGMETLINLISTHKKESTGERGTYH